MGLDDIRPFFFRQGDMQFYATEKVFKALSQRFDYIFDENYQYPGVPEITKNYIVKNVPFNVKEFQFLPIEVDHAGMQVLGFRIGRLAYITDIKHITEDQIELLDNLDVLIINALRHESHHSHLSLSEAVDLGKRIGANRTYFTHISHTMGFHSEVSAELPEGFFLAYDNLKLEFDSNE
jgi:phosphoribosyl 1,2-cyclic phosphate phosphodiesterase